MIVKIKNWDKFNPRKDVKSASWFRMENDFLTDPDIYGQSMPVKLVWIHILSQASKKNCETVKLNILMAAGEVGCDETEVGKAVDYLTSINSLEKVSHDRIRSDPAGSGRKRTATGRNETNVTNVTNEKAIVGLAPDPSPKSDFEIFGRIWNEFAGLKNLSSIKSISKGRKTKLAARIYEGLTPDKYVEMLEAAALQPFLMGRNDRGWKLSFDWTMANEENGLKALEGKYKGTGRGRYSNADAVEEAIASYETKGGF